MLRQQTLNSIIRNIGNDGIDITITEISLTKNSKIFGYNISNNDKVIVNSLEHNHYYLNEDNCKREAIIKCLKLSTP